MLEKVVATQGWSESHDFTGFRDGERSDRSFLHDFFPTVQIRSKKKWLYVQPNRGMTRIGDSFHFLSGKLRGGTS
jgi:hypothetical protein